VCHIKGNRKGAKRYDENQAEEDRQSVSNLIIMCPKHHDVIDDDEESYTVERLLKMKAVHEAQNQGEEAGQQMAEQFAVAIQNNLFHHGSLIYSQNQSGGATAHTINNYYQPHVTPEILSQALLEADLACH
jgi:hypothetical protein